MMTRRRTDSGKPWEKGDKKAAGNVPPDVLAFMGQVEAAVKRYFPQGFFTSRVDESYSGPALDMYFATATLPKGQQTNGILENDLAYQTYWIFSGATEAGLNPKLQVKMSQGGKLHTRVRPWPKIGWRNKTGTPAQIVAHFNRYYAKLKSMVDAQGGA